MGTCVSCGSAVSEDVRFCGKCGAGVPSSALAGLPPAPSLEVSTPNQPRWYVTYATGQRGGPFNQDQVRAMIARQELKITDSVLVEGGNTWAPITQSPFANSIASQAHMSRLASSTCPRCGGSMVVILRMSGTAKFLMLGGLLTIWMFGFGIIFIIIGLIVGRNKVPRYECPLCKYKAK